MRGAPERARAIVGALVVLALLAAATGAAAHGTDPLPGPGQAASGPAAAPPPAAAGCSSSADPAAFASVNRMLEWNRVMAQLGPRPTGSGGQARFVRWLRRQVAALPGMQLDSVSYEIDRQLERQVGLAAGGEEEPLAPVPVSGPVPYSQPTPDGGVTGRLEYVPGDQSLADRDIEGRIVVRDAPTGSIPNLAFSAVEWWRHDPDLSLTLDAPESYERDWLANERRIAELEQAAEGGAAGLVFVHSFPREQVRGQYTPYHGRFFDLPAVYVGVDERERLKQLARDGGVARVHLSASREPASTETVVATLPGQTDERIVVTSHTDGMNAIWDNGPIAMLALAEHFASQPRECRPRTLQFTFTTAHLYQQLVEGQHGGAAEQYAKQLDRDYDAGTVALVIALEHLGAREYEAQPRTDGPGRMLVPTGRSEPTTIFIGESPVLVKEMLRSVAGRQLSRTIALRGSDAPRPHLPPHRLAGESTFYHAHLIPTVSLITGPWSLLNPAFGMEALDGELLYKQTLVFADFIHSIDATPREALAGAYVAERGGRSALCGASEDGAGLTDCGR